MRLETQGGAEATVLSQAAWRKNCFFFEKPVFSLKALVSSAHIKEGNLPSSKSMYLNVNCT